MKVLHPGSPSRCLSLTEGKVVQATLHWLWRGFTGEELLPSVWHAVTEGVINGMQCSERYRCRRRFGGKAALVCTVRPAVLT